MRQKTRVVLDTLVRGDSDAHTNKYAETSVVHAVSAHRGAPVKGKLRILVRDRHTRDNAFRLQVKKRNIPCLSVYVVGRCYKDAVRSRTTL